MPSWSSLHFSLSSYIFCHFFIYLLCSDHKFCVPYKLVPCLRLGIPIHPTRNILSWLTHGNWNSLIQSNLSWPTWPFRLLETHLLETNLSYHLSNSMIIVYFLISTVNFLTKPHHICFLTQWLVHSSNSLMSLEWIKGIMSLEWIKWMSKLPHKHLGHVLQKYSGLCWNKMGLFLLLESSGIVT